MPLKCRSVSSRIYALVFPFSKQWASMKLLTFQDVKLCTQSVPFLLCFYGDVLQWILTGLVDDWGVNGGPERCPDRDG